MKNIVVLISGGGSNMAAIVNAAQQQRWQQHYGARVMAVVSNQPSAKGLEFARAQGIATEVLEHQPFPGREAFDAELAAVIDRYDPALVVLAGFMRILSPGFVNHYAGRLVNIHPSLLPAFPGLHTHQRAIDAGCKFAGASVHWVTADLDAGYWQVLMHWFSRDKTGFFAPEGKKHFCNLPMGIKNAAPFFVCMMMELKKIWSYRFFETQEGLKLIGRAKQWYARLAPAAIKDNGLQTDAIVLRQRERPDSSIIIDDLLAFSKTPLLLIAYWMAILQVFVEYRVSIKL